MYELHMEHITQDVACSINISSDYKEVTARGMKEFFLDGQQEIQQVTKVADVSHDDVLPFNIICKFLYTQLVEEMPELIAFDEFFLMPPD